MLTPWYSSSRMHVAGLGFFLGARAGDLSPLRYLAIGTEHLVVHRVGVVCAQELARRQWQGELRLAMGDGDELGQRAHVVLQCPVKWPACNTCATSQVSTRLTGHSSSSGVSIQSRISPKASAAHVGRVSPRAASWRLNAFMASSPAKYDDAAIKNITNRSGRIFPGSNPGRARWHFL